MLATSSAINKKETDAIHGKRRRSSSILKNPEQPMMKNNCDDNNCGGGEPTLTITKKVRRVSFAEKQNVKIFEIENASTTTSEDAGGGSGDHINETHFSACGSQRSSLMSLCSSTRSHTEMVASLTTTSQIRTVVEPMSICDTEDGEVDGTADFLNSVLHSEAQQKLLRPEETNYGLEKEIENSEKDVERAESVATNKSVVEMEITEEFEKNVATTKKIEITEEKSVNVKKLWESFRNGVAAPSDEVEDVGKKKKSKKRKKNKEKRKLEEEKIQNSTEIPTPQENIAAVVERPQICENKIEIAKKEKEKSKIERPPEIRENGVEIPKNEKAENSKTEQEEMTKNREILRAKNENSKFEQEETKKNREILRAKNEKAEKLKIEQEEIKKNREILLAKRKETKEKAKFEHEKIQKSIEFLRTKQKEAEKTGQKLKEEFLKLELSLFAKNSSSDVEKTLKIYPPPWKKVEKSSDACVFLQFWRFIVRIEENVTKFELDSRDYCTEEERRDLFSPFYEFVLNAKLRPAAENFSRCRRKNEEKLNAFLEETGKLVVQAESTYKIFLEIFLLFVDVKFENSKLIVKFYPKRSFVQTETIVSVDVWTYPSADVSLIAIKNGCEETIKKKFEEAKLNHSSSYFLPEFFRSLKTS